jgi:hypothetical protein
MIRAISSRMITVHSLEIEQPSAADADDGAKMSQKKGASPVMDDAPLLVMKTGSGRR